MATSTAQVKLEVLDYFSKSIPQIRKLNKELQDLQKITNSFKNIDKVFKILEGINTIKSVTNVNKLNHSMNELGKETTSTASIINRNATSIERDLNKMSASIDKMRFKSAFGNIFEDRAPTPPKQPRAQYQNRGITTNQIYGYGALYAGKNFAENALNNVGQYEDAIFVIQKAIHGSKDDLKDYIKEVDRLSFKFGLSRVEAAKVFGEVRKFTGSIKEASNAFEQSYFVQNVFDTENPIISTRQLASLQTKSGYSGDRMKKFLAFLFENEKVFGNVNASDILNAMSGRIQPRKDISMEQQAYMVTLGLSAGVRPEVAGSATAQSLEEISKKRPDLVKKNGLFGAFKALEKETSTMSEVQKTNVLESIFGSELRQTGYIKGILAAYQRLREGEFTMVESNKVLMKSLDELGRTYEELLTTKIQNASSTLEVFKAGSESVATTIGQVLMPSLAENRDEFSQFILSLNQNIKKYNEEIKAMAIATGVTAGAMILALTPLLTLLSTLLPLIGLATTSFMSVSTMLKLGDEVKGADDRKKIADDLEKSLEKIKKIQKTYPQLSSSPENLSNSLETLRTRQLGFNSLQNNNVNQKNMSRNDSINIRVSADEGLRANVDTKTDDPYTKINQVIDKGNMSVRRDFLPTSPLSSFF